MSKKTKVRVIVASVIGILLIILYVIVSKFYKVPFVEKKVYIPTGSLVDSVFEEQNMNHTPNENLTYYDDFRYAPVSFSAPPSQSARVNGANWRMMGDNYVFTYDLPYGKLPSDMGSLIQYQVTSVISSSANEENTVVTCLNEENGAINGCRGFCYTYEIQVENVKDKYYASVFVLWMDESFELPREMDSEMIVGCMGTGCDEIFMQERYDIATAIVRSFGLNNEYYRRESYIK